MNVSDACVGGEKIVVDTPFVYGERSCARMRSLVVVVIEKCFLDLEVL